MLSPEVVQRSTRVTYGVMDHPVAQKWPPTVMTVRGGGRSINRHHKSGRVPGQDYRQFHGLDYYDSMMESIGVFIFTALQLH